ncbi:DNA replication checkpoint protein tel2 [Candida viswanathii]|uniref:DNA replication checkpoint protein tel2 n=1 Tax=Candida viswanathii TaxID=5486 RepID=A0A367YHN9_9ASCO|nr:DNA replication checkpoint protein tel2 [Candida viswanathii]
MDKDTELLKNQPSLDQVEAILSHNVDHPSFPYIIALLDFTIPQIYSALTPSAGNLLVQTFQSLVGLGNLLNRISTIVKVSGKRELLQTFVRVLEEVVRDQQLVLRMVSKAKPIELKEIDKILFKGRALSVVNEATSIASVDVASDVFPSTANYIDYLSKSLIALYLSDVQPAKIDVFLHSVLKFGSGSFNQFFKTFFHEEYWHYFVTSFQSMKQFQQREYTRKFFAEFLIHVVDETNLVALYNILLFTYEQFDEFALESIILCSNKNLSQLVAAIVTNYPDSTLDKLTYKLLGKWSEQTYIKNELISIQESRTFLILQLLARRKGSVFTKELPKNRIFLDAIGNRLLSFSNNVKGLGVVLADYVCELNGEEKIFKMSAEVEAYSGLIKGAFVTTRLSEKEAWTALELPPHRDTSQPIQRVLSPQPDSDNESDDETLPPKANIPDPIYVKDLLEYLTIDTAKSNAYEMRRKALLDGPTLLRQKAKNGTEVEFYLEDLLTQLIALDNHFDDKDFSDLKLANMVAVIVTNPKITFFMFKLLLTGDYSLQQRIMILSATTMAARELRGFRDESVSKSFKSTQFPTKMLPETLHKKYLQLEGGDKYIDYALNNLQNELMAEASNTAQDELLGAGKLVRVSAKLNKPSKPQDGTPIIKDFYKLIGTNFFFPLLNVWYEAGSIDIGHYSPVFVAHYLKTLTLLVHCAYPSSTQLNDMVKEIVVLDCAIIRKITMEEVPIVESVITGILLVCEITDSEFLIANYNDEIVFIRNWLSISWEQIIDDKLKSLAAGLLLKLQNMETNFERLIMDQDNSIIQI